MTTYEHKEKLETIKMWLYSGTVTYAQAENLAKPHIDAMNEKSKEIAKKCGVKPKYFNFASFMR